MKQIIFASLVLSLFSGITATAQSNGGYQDDVYYSGSQAEQDAKAEAKRQKKQQTNSSADYYNSSEGNYDNNTNGNNQTYSNSYSGQDDAYVDYDDDGSYTTRIRRFYYPMYSVGYWGSVYSPFYNDPFYSNPYYGWGGWYTPGISIGIGFGGPYWSNCWGMSTWFGYGGFGSWYYPYGGFGYGGAYSAGYWNGYYAGMYDGGRYSYGRTIVNNGLRGSGRGAGAYNVGAYGSNSGLRASNVRGGNSGTFEPQSARRQMTTGTEASTFRTNRGNNGDFQQVDAGRRVNNNVVNRNINLDQSGAVREFSGNTRGTQQVQQGGAQQSSRSGGFFNFNRNNSNNIQQDRSTQRVDQGRNNNFPSQQRSNVAPVQQQRSNFSPSTAPSRSFSPSSAPSRSGGGGSFGGGSRSSGGGRR